MIVDCIGGNFGDSLMPRIEASNLALQLGKFFDEFRGEVGFGESGSGIEGGGIATLDVRG